MRGSGPARKVDEMRYRLIIEVGYANADESHDPALREALAALVSHAAEEGLFTGYASLDAVAVEQLGVAIQRLEEPAPEPEEAKK